jgi:hypothetical protein
MKVKGEGEGRERERGSWRRWVETKIAPFAIRKFLIPYDMSVMSSCLPLKKSGEDGEEGIQTTQ